MQDSAECLSLHIALSTLMDQEDAPELRPVRQAEAVVMSQSFGKEITEDACHRYHVYKEVWKW